MTPPMRSDDATTREVAKDFVQRHIEWLEGQLALYSNDPDADIAGEIAIYQYILVTISGESR